MCYDIFYLIINYLRRHDKISLILSCKQYYEYYLLDIQIVKPLENYYKEYLPINFAYDYLKKIGVYDIMKKYNGSLNKNTLTPIYHYYHNNFYKLPYDIPSDIVPYPIHLFTTLYEDKKFKNNESQEILDKYVIYNVVSNIDKSFYLSCNKSVLQDPVYSRKPLTHSKKIFGVVISLAIICYGLFTI